ncbi:helix-turn-helix domain-containing protein [Microcoleus sp. EPA2]|uniref:helix-turn-helix domain-containing protein n=1 Tax=Microcoleus sp. EPA2 TaxID=2841654 RepID=UPI00312BAF0D
MNYKEARRQFAAKVSQLRREKRITQDELAELIDKTTDYISLLERGERSPSFEVIFSLAEALDVPATYLISFSQSGENKALVNTLIAEPVSPSVVEPVEEAVTTKEERISDAKRLENAMKSIQELQTLANEYGITDIFQDNGGKTLQLLILLGLRISPGREGNDAIDAEGKEYELKTINISLNRSGGVTTHHHLNEIILEKYRKVGAWYIGLYEGITLKQIYKLTPELLEPKFKEWEEKLKIRNDALNNPKIPLKLVRRGELVYSDSQG